MLFIHEFTIAVEIYVENQANLPVSKDIDMSKIRVLTALATTLALSAASLAQAESIVDGIYMSDGDDRGLAKCTLTIKAVSDAHKYGDEVFDLESSGDGSCEWSARAISKSFSITGGMVTNGGTPAFIKLTFPFGPAGKRIEMTMFELDGTLRQEDVFNKESDLVASK